VIGHAELSDDGVYRWLLTRRWPSLQSVGKDGRAREPYALWIGLNPSTADAHEDDHTIRRIRGFCERWNLSGFAVANLFAGRATKPRDLYRMEDPIGPGDRGLRRLVDAARGAELVICCWGANERRASDWPRERWSIDSQPFELTMRGRASQVCQALAREGADLHCLGTSRDGHPLHPARLRNDTQLEPFDGLKRYPPERHDYVDGPPRGQRGGGNAGAASRRAAGAVNAELVVYRRWLPVLYDAEPKLLWQLRSAWATGRRVALSLERADFERMEGIVTRVAASGAFARVRGRLVPLDRVLALHYPSRLGDSDHGRRAAGWAGVGRGHWEPQEESLW
jgi:hypothetical protein